MDVVSLENKMKQALVSFMERLTEISEEYLDDHTISSHVLERVNKDISAIGDFVTHDYIGSIVHLLSTDERREAEIEAEREESEYESMVRNYWEYR